MIPVALQLQPCTYACLVNKWHHVQVGMVCPIRIHVVWVLSNHISSDLARWQLSLQTTHKSLVPHGQPTICPSFEQTTMNEQNGLPLQQVPHPKEIMSEDL